MMSILFDGRLAAGSPAVCSAPDPMSPWAPSHALGESSAGRSRSACRYSISWSGQFVVEHQRDHIGDSVVEDLSNPHQQRLASSDTPDLVRLGSPVLVIRDHIGQDIRQRRRGLRDALEAVGAG